MSNLANSRVNVKFNNSVLEQNSSFSLYGNFILNLYIVYEWNKWLCRPTNSFPLKNCLFVTIKLVRNAIKSKFTYNGRGIAFDGEDSWSFGNDFARDVLIFGIDNNSSSHTDNQKNNLLVLGERPIGINDGISESTGAAKKRVLTLVKQIQSFA